VTQVAFHFGAPDKVAYTCRLLRKAVGSGAKVAVLASPATTSRLDMELWGVGAIDFVPHCMDSASASLLRHSPIVLSQDAQTLPALENPVLVQLCHPVPQIVKACARVIEIVSLDELDRAEARVRWKAYAAWGIAIQKHDLALKEHR
jgi:DNA polymerase-3 subunit chi